LSGYLKNQLEMIIDDIVDGKKVIKIPTPSFKQSTISLLVNMMNALAKMSTSNYSGGPDIRRVLFLPETEMANATIGSKEVYPEYSQNPVKVDNPGSVDILLGKLETKKLISVKKWKELGSVLELSNFLNVPVISRLLATYFARHINKDAKAKKIFRSLPYDLQAFICRVYYGRLAKGFDLKKIYPRKGEGFKKLLKQFSPGKDGEREYWEERAK